ncbi:MAG TPA: threonine--tRNA ligase [Candidatus Dormibacteraeota bacterium]|nr:threonine--tRNA ligase [Candidatus Dormibacteraeota bacterium]
MMITRGEQMPEINNEIYAMRHSLAHILATAVQSLWPDAKFGVGPVVENGFYYDIDLGKHTLSEDDLVTIEAEMHKVIAADYMFEHFDKPIDEAIAWARDNNQPYKEELLNDLKRAGTTAVKDLDAAELGSIAEGDSKIESASFYKDGNFTDLCRGPHLESTAKVGAFKLERVSGAYWRGNQKNAQMQRIYGVGFKTKDELDNYLKLLEEVKLRDHRRLGQDLKLFFFHETAPGMPYWLPNGVNIYNELINFWREEHAKRQYQEIFSPLLNKKELYQTSGHFDHYWKNMFTSKTEENEEYGLKAMNCPNAMIVFGSTNHSYRDLPLRLSDTDTLHRYELSGTLNGLLRVREFRQDDAHIFVTEEQIKEEYAQILEITDLFYSIFGMQYSFRLGTRPDKFLGDEALWNKAESILKQILVNSQKEYFILEGDGAFYGPKIDILMKDALGREWQMGTIQLDFQQPLRFGLKYTDQDGKEKTPIAIHRVIYGSLERFIGILTEHLAGKFPVWLAPEQIRIISVNQEQNTLQFAQTVVEKAQDLRLRVVVDNSNETVGKKIRSSELMKVPYTVVIGEKEIDSNQVTPRIRKDMIVNPNAQAIGINEFLKTVANEVKSRVSKTSL